MFQVPVNAESPKPLSLPPPALESLEAANDSGDEGSYDCSDDQVNHSSFYYRLHCLHSGVKLLCALVCCSLCAVATVLAPTTHARIATPATITSTTWYALPHMSLRKH
jgi:hypothetical protein